MPILFPVLLLLVITNAAYRDQPVADTNHMCPLNRVGVRRDKHSDFYLCSKCVPGTTGISSMLRTGDDTALVNSDCEEATCQPNRPSDRYLSYSCNINEFCSDHGECLPIKQHPFIGASCVDDRFCGGLYCVKKTCQLCPSLLFSEFQRVRSWCTPLWKSLLQPLPLLLFICSVFSIVIMYFCYQTSLTIPSLPPLLKMTEKDAEDLNASIYHVQTLKTESKSNCEIVNNDKLSKIE
ncbi:hypothetical protein P9112_000139 [Eukaryota sp. TZLM1-RC]